MSNKALKVSHRVSAFKEKKDRNSWTQQATESAFVSKLEDLFDVAYTCVLTTKKVLQEDNEI